MTTMLAAAAGALSGFLVLAQAVTAGPLAGPEGAWLQYGAMGLLGAALLITVPMIIRAIERYQKAQIAAEERRAQQRAAEVAQFFEAIRQMREDERKTILELARPITDLSAAVRNTDTLIAALPCRRLGMVTTVTSPAGAGVFPQARKNWPGG